MNAFKALVFALVLFFQTSWVFAAATLMGVVRENQVGGSPAKNVLISALGANRIPTGDDGQFMLHFPQLGPGEDVNIDVSRNGWAVVNDLQLTHRFPANTTQSPLLILIAKAAERDAWALKFYRLQSQRVWDKQYKRKLAELEGRNAARTEELAGLLRERHQADEMYKRKLARLENRVTGELTGYAGATRARLLSEQYLADEMYRQMLAKLEGHNAARAEARLLRERDQAEAQADLLSRQLAARSVSAISEDYRKGAALFLEGRMDEALEILSEERLKRQAADMKKPQEDTLRSWLLRGQLLSVKFDFDGAARAYKQAVEFAPNSYVAWFEYSFFQEKQQCFREARAGYEKILVLARASGRDEDVASVRGNRAYIREVQEASDESLKISGELAQQNPSVYLLYVAVTLNNLGNLHRAENRMAEARYAYEESLEIYQSFAKVAPAVYEPYVRTVQGNLDALP